MAAKYTNNASTTLASSISSGATAFSVPSGKGDLFPILGAGEWCYLTLVKLVGGVEVLEIVKATARATDNFTIVRAQQGTVATSFTAGDKVDCRVTAGGLAEMAPLDSPVMTGTPKVPTQLVSDDSTNASSTAFANRAAANALAQVAGATAVLASAATVNIGAANVGNISITGTVAITAFDNYAEGTRRWIVFAGATVLTHNVTSLQLPTSANITTAVGDTALFKSLGGGNWKCLVYQRANGNSLVQLPQASGSVSGYLSSTDWSTFNGKQVALGYTPINSAVFAPGGLAEVGRYLDFHGTSNAYDHDIRFDAGPTPGSTGAGNGTWTCGAMNFVMLSGAGAPVYAGGFTANGADGSSANMHAGSGIAGLSLYTPGGLKYIRVSSSNNLDFINSTNSAFLATLTDSGQFSATQITQTSDERKKTNWQPLTDEQLDALANMQRSGVFEWIDGSGPSVGGSAQEIRAIVPEAVHEDEQGNLTVNYGGLNFAMQQATLRRLWGTK